MTVLSLNEFNGIVESLNVPQLPPGMASEARNVVLRRKTLDDLPSPKDTGTNLPGSGRRTLFRYRYKTDAGVTTQVWLSFAARVHVVSAPLADDSHDRVYWTQEGGVPQDGGLRLRTQRRRFQAGHGLPGEVLRPGGSCPP